MESTLSDGQTLASVQRRARGQCGEGEGMVQTRRQMESDLWHGLRAEQAFKYNMCNDSGTHVPSLPHRNVVERTLHARFDSSTAALPAQRCYGL